MDLNVFLRHTDKTLQEPFHAVAEPLIDEVVTKDQGARGITHVIDIQLAILVKQSPALVRLLCKHRRTADPLYKELEYAKVLGDLMLQFSPFGLGITYEHLGFSIVEVQKELERIPLLLIDARGVYHLGAGTVLVDLIEEPLETVSTHLLFDNVHVSVQQGTRYSVDSGVGGSHDQMNDWNDNSGFGQLERVPRVRT